MALVNLLMNLTDSSATFLSYSPLGNTLAGDKQTSINNFINYLKRIRDGQSYGSLLFQSGAVQAQATLTSTGIATATETFTLQGVVFTARAGGAAGNEFNVSAVVATQATNIAAAINASTDVNPYFIATSLAGVVTIKVIQPGVLGNIYTLTETLTNVALSNFVTQATGSNGTAITVDLS
jgi:hypothetical protein